MTHAELVKKIVEILDPPLHSREWFLDRAREAGRTMAAIRKILPGCFDEHGHAIVASAHFPRD